MKILLQFFLLLSTFFCIHVNAAPIQKVTIVGDLNYPPYSFQEAGQPQGLYVDILKQALEYMPQYQVDIQMAPWKRALSMVENNQRVAVFPPYYWPQKRPYIGSYSAPLFTEEVIVICDSKRVPPTSKQWPEDFYGLKIGSNLGFLAPGKEFFAAAMRGDIALVETQNSEIGLRMLLLKRIDCYVNDKLTIRWTLSQLLTHDIYQHLPDNLPESLAYRAIVAKQTAHLGFSVDAKNRYGYRKDFEEKLNRVILRMTDSGEIQQIVDRFLFSLSQAK